MRPPAARLAEIREDVDDVGCNPERQDIRDALAEVDALTVVVDAARAVYAAGQGERDAALLRLGAALRDLDGEP